MDFAPAAFPLPGRVTDLIEAMRSLCDESALTGLSEGRIRCAADGFTEYVLW